jgi:hypothetical protein
MLQRVDIAKHVRVLISGCEPDENSEETNVMIEEDDNDILLSIKTTKASGRVFHSTARIPLEKLYEAVTEVTKTQNSPD